MHSVAAPKVLRLQLELYHDLLIIVGEVVDALT